MYNLLEEIIKFKEYQKKWPEYMLNDILVQIHNLNNEIVVDWDSASGEEWASVLKGRNVLAIFAVKIPLAFIKEELVNLINIYNPEILNEIYCIKVNEFDKKDWFVNLEEYKLRVPELAWHACLEAVSPKAFSINDFLYATI